MSTVDALVSKPVLGSDGAARWQTFQQDTGRTIESRETAPKAPLKKNDRLQGSTTWQDERTMEVRAREESGAVPLHSGYTYFKSGSSAALTQEQKRVRDRIRPEEAEYYIAASTFEGFKFDHVFTTRDRGTGYYWDGMDSWKRLQKSLAGMQNDDIEATGAVGITDSDAIAGTKHTRDDNDDTNDDNNKLDTGNELAKKKSRKKGLAPVTIVSDANNPVEQVHKAQQRQQQIQASLPPGWQAALDSSQQKYYYFNRSTGERTWEHPQASKQGATAPNDLPEEWQAVTDAASQKVYYYNTTTRETRWTKPSA
jgi:WW domain